jgi:hypothetical protein
LVSRIQIPANCHWLVRSHIPTCFNDQVLTTHNLPAVPLVEPMAALKVRSTPMTFQRHVVVITQLFRGTIFGTNQLMC